MFPEAIFDYRVNCGRWDMLDDSEEGQIRKVDKIILHEEFGSEIEYDTKFDIGLVGFILFEMYIYVFLICC